MAKTREQKEKMIQAFEDNLTKMKSAVFVDYKGLKVKDITTLRKSLRENNVEFSVAKTTLLKKALEKNEIVVDEEILSKPLAVAFAMEDEVAPAKEIEKFAKTNDVIEVLGGILERKMISSGEVKRLAALPSREQLYSRVVGTIAAPLNGFVNVFAGNLRGLVNVLNAVKDSKAS